MLQGNKLTMLGVGNAATAGFGRGIHTRWHFRAALKWPKFGFTLFRRAAAKGVSTCVNFPKIVFLDPKRMSFSFDSGAEGKGTVTSSVSMTAVPGPPPVIRTSSGATITFECNPRFRQFSVNLVCARGTMSLKAYDGPMLVASTSRAASGAAATLTVSANRISTVVLETQAATTIRSICWVPIVDGDWTGLVDLNLPRDWAVADSRLPSSLSAAARTRYRDSWPRLDKVIRKVTSGVISESLAEQSGAEDAPTLDANYIHLLQAAALDPNIARILGLYYQDESAALSTLYDYKIAGNWSAPRSADHEWICFGLSRGALPAVTRPTGLTSVQVDLPGGIAGVAKSQSAVALGWTINRSADGQLAQTSPVMYHVYRQDKKPAGTWTVAKHLTRNRPVIAKAAASDPRYYTDGPLALNSYRYKISGVDIFGRESALSAMTSITVTDNVAPPPPVSVAASIVDTEAPSPVDIEVTWSWTDTQREQAGDAKLFRVYHQYEDLYPVSGTVTAVAAGTVADTSDLTTDLDTSGDYSRFEDGFLIHGGARFVVTGITVSGGAVIVTVENNADADGARTVSPAVAVPSASFAYLSFLPDAWKMKGRFLLKTDWSNSAHWQSSHETKNVTSAEEYSATISDVPVAVDSATPVASMFVAVCTEDANGNVGPLSVPVKVQATNVTAPAAPVLAIGDEEYASKADWYGNSKYTVAIPSAPAGVRYEILRATDAGLAKAAGSTSELEDISDDDLKAWADDTESSDSTMLTYRTAFMNVGTASADFEDSFPGTARNRYIYKVRSIDSANNRGEFADAFVVHLHDVTPPGTPIVTTVTAGDCEITLTWARNNERDLAGYRVFRSITEESSSDIRAMDMVHELPAGTQSVTDSVTGLTDYYYRIVAFDTSDNVSSATAALRLRAYDGSL